MLCVRVCLCDTSHCPITQVTYTTVASRFIKGVDPISGNGSPLEKFAGAGYQQVSVCFGLCVSRSACMVTQRACKCLAG